MWYTKTFFVIFLVTAIGIPFTLFSIGFLNREGYSYLARASNDTSYLTRYYQVKYRSVEEIYEYMHNLVTNYRFFCTIHEIGHTGHKGELAGYPIYMVSLSSGFVKPNILVIGGVYANDWASVTSTLFLINELLINCESSGTLVTRYNWKFIPMLNPDGYNYSKSMPTGDHWIKNIARWSMDATGVNLNYNFATHWKSNYNFHEDTYPGIDKFSEIESQILRDFVTSINRQIEMVVILRSATKRFQVSESYITYPWSHTTEKVQNWYVLKYLATLASRGTNQELNSTFQVLQSGDCEQNQSGAIDDWLYSSARIQKVFTIQRNFKASKVDDPFDFIRQLGKEVFIIIQKIVSNKLTHPSDYTGRQATMIPDYNNARKMMSPGPKKKF